MNKKFGPKKTISKNNLRHLHGRINNVKKVEDFLPKEKVITLEFPVSELEKLLRGFRYVRDMVIRISPYNHIKVIEIGLIEKWIRRLESELNG